MTKIKCSHCRLRQHRHRPHVQGCSAASCSSRSGWSASTAAATGLARAREHGPEDAPPRASTAWCRTCKADGIRIAFDATSAPTSIAENAASSPSSACVMIDLTPAAIGPYCVPPVNLKEHVGKGEMNVNMVTCGGQATIPIVAAVSRVQPVDYGEIVATVASQVGRPRHAQEHRRVHPHHGQRASRRSAAPRQRQGHHLSTRPTAADHARHHPLPDRGRARPGGHHRLDRGHDRARCSSYVPGYKLKNGPVFDGKRVSVFMEVGGSATTCRSTPATSTS